MCLYLRVGAGQRRWIYLRSDGVSNYWTSENCIGTLPSHRCWKRQELVGWIIEYSSE